MGTGDEEYDYLFKGKSHCFKLAEEFIKNNYKLNT